MFIIRAFRTSESESADFSEVRVRNFRTLKTLRTRTQRVCLFTNLYCKEVNISQKISEISIFSFLKSYYSLYKPHAQISTIVKTSYVFHWLIILGQGVWRSRFLKSEPESESESEFRTSVWVRVRWNGRVRKALIIIVYGSILPPFPSNWAAIVGWHGRWLPHFSEMVLPPPTLPPLLFTLNGLARSTFKREKLDWSKIAYSWK
jgi:hypothetical protein